MPPAPSAADLYGLAEVDLLVSLDALAAPSPLAMLDESHDLPLALHQLREQELDADRLEEQRLEAQTRAGSPCGLGEQAQDSAGMLDNTGVNDGAAPQEDTAPQDDVAGQGAVAMQNGSAMQNGVDVDVAAQHDASVQHDSSLQNVDAGLDDTSTQDAVTMQDIVTTPDEVMPQNDAATQDNVTPQEEETMQSVLYNAITPDEDAQAVADAFAAALEGAPPLELVVPTLASGDALGACVGGADSGTDAGGADLETDAGRAVLGTDTGGADLRTDTGGADLGTAAGGADLETDAGRADLGTDTWGPQQDPLFDAAGARAAIVVGSPAAGPVVLEAVSPGSACGAAGPDMLGLSFGDPAVPFWEDPDGSSPVSEGVAVDEVQVAAEQVAASLGTLHGLAGPAGMRGVADGGGAAVGLPLSVKNPATSMMHSDAELGSLGGFGLRPAVREGGWEKAQGAAAAAAAAAAAIMGGGGARSGAGLGGRGRGRRTKRVSKREAARAASAAASAREQELAAMAKARQISDAELLRLKPKKVRRAARFDKPVPSRFCHVCSRTPKNVRLAVCAKIREGTCRKVICEKCFAEYAYGDFAAALRTDVSSWTCPHCVGACPARAQCRTYQRINDRLRADRLKQERPRPKGPRRRRPDPADPDPKRPRLLLPAGAPAPAEGTAPDAVDDFVGELLLLGAPPHGPVPAE